MGCRPRGAVGRHHHSMLFPPFSTSAGLGTRKSMRYNPYKRYAGRGIGAEVWSDSMLLITRRF
jgi:hypothetical protein